MYLLHKMGANNDLEYGTTMISAVVAGKIGYELTIFWSSKWWLSPATWKCY